MSVIDEVHEPPTLLHRENEFPSDKDTDLPLSPQAETYYRSGKPFLQRYLPFGAASIVERLLKVGALFLLVLLPFVRTLPALYRWRVKRKLALVYRRLIEAEVAANAGMPRLWERSPRSWTSSRRLASRPSCSTR